MKLKWSGRLFHSKNKEVEYEISGGAGIYAPRKRKMGYRVNSDGKQEFPDSLAICCNLQHHHVWTHKK